MYGDFERKLKFGTDPLWLPHEFTEESPLCNKLSAITSHLKIWTIIYSQ